MAVSDELAVRRATAPEPIDNASLPAGSPMYYYCHSCGHQTAVKPENWVDSPPPRHCAWCAEHGYSDGHHNL